MSDTLLNLFAAVSHASPGANITDHHGGLVAHVSPDINVRGGITLHNGSHSMSIEPIPGGIRGTLAEVDPTTHHIHGYLRPLPSGGFAHSHSLCGPLDVVAQPFGHGFTVSDATHHSAIGVINSNATGDELTFSQSFNPFQSKF